MKVFYFCSTGKGPSAIAAAIHLEMLPVDTIPQLKDYGQLSFLKKFTFNKVGEVLFVGRDKHGNCVYTFGLGREKTLLKKAVKDVIKVNNKSNQCILVDTCFADNEFFKWGQRLGGGLGLFLYAKGSQSEYLKLACTVRHTLKELARLVQT